MEFNSGFKGLNMEVIKHGIASFNPLPRGLSQRNPTIHCYFSPLDRRLNDPSWCNSSCSINKHSTLEHTSPLPHIV